MNTTDDHNIEKYMGKENKINQYNILVIDPEINKQTRIW